ncbi:acyl-CoA--6-aminopenicillanic acid acyl-transferase [Flavobacterium sp. xlx-214]|uniref:C45 family autoproteolytic acyltransferase/hydolase n=1 Tax=unclassified Flavobacterium TaxID=196869 RepID=UPI0013D8A98A|nr:MULTISPECIES: C45 family peptidase [unclassified Flavobacterium]MBA5792090.1 acyl-CoA--6-aminopenicillanic acid acyl-transferase [Flavobacterium sp. xlx-221]QMI84337.1 acyl-CoA--6-aminopenicillanic acid acyl-transferase [Flavobacterium sp. xlx-214]
MNKYFWYIIIVSFLVSCGGIHHLKSESKTYQTNLQDQTIALTKFDVLNKSENGNWQLRLQGNPYELGYKKGLLTKDLYQNQERVFFDKVAEIVPNPSKQKQMLKFLKWYNRTILDHTPISLKEELFALSSFATNEYDDLGTKFERNLLLHSSHDIGHAMQDLMLVGCSSIALWGQYTEDGNLLIGRNFDFYVNDAFAQNKIVEFISPDKGYKYASVTWPGMIGVVSGMNEKGLTVTLNAGKSSIPLKGKTPVSIVARYILQHTKNIEEAVKLAQTFEVFVSESILIGSAQDNKAVVIEISPKKFDVFEANNGKLMCTNHFQSAAYQSDKRNQDHIETSHSYYRLQKLEESLQQEKTYQVNDVLHILRDVSGLNEKNIGLGNEKSLNQLIAHHGIIFKPKEGMMWVSNNPYQLGAFDAYNLNDIFANKELKPIKKDELKADDFLLSDAYKKIQVFKNLEPLFFNAIKNKSVLPDDILTNFEQSNPEFWLTYKLLGDYYNAQKDYQKASKAYEQSLTKEISSENERNNVLKKYQKATKKL